MTGAQIKYLLTMYRMQNDKGIRLKDIAAEMKISKPSVYQMISQLGKLGLTESDSRGCYALTEAGAAAAAEYTGQYHALCGFFTEQLGLQHGSADAAAASLLAIDGEILAELCSCIQKRSELGTTN